MRIYGYNFYISKSKALIYFLTARERGEYKMFRPSDTPLEEGNIKYPVLRTPL